MGHIRTFGQLAFAALLAASPMAASAANCDASTFAEFVTCAGAGGAGDTVTRDSRPTRCDWQTSPRAPGPLRAATR